MSDLPPLPPGATLDNLPPLPPGAKLDQPTNADWQSQVKPTTTFNGKSSVQRADGGVWYGPDQGNTGRPGWFDDKGTRLGDAPGQTPAPGFLGGVASGLKTAGRAAAQSAGHFMGHVLEGAFPSGTENVPQGWVHQADQDYAQRQAQADAEVARGGFPARAGAVVGQALPAVAATALTAGEAAPSMIGRIAQAAPMVAGSTYVTTPGTEKEKATAAAIAVPVAAAAQPVVEGAGWLGGKAFNALKGVISPKAAQVMADSEAAGVSLRPSTIQAAIKAAPPEVQQAQAATDAFAANLSQDVKNTPFSGLPEVEAAAAGTGPRKAAAQAILDQVNSGGQDAKDLVQTSAGLTSLREKMRLEALANQRAALAQGVTVQPTKALGVIDAALEEMNGVDASKWPVKDAAIAKLQAFRDSAGGANVMLRALGLLIGFAVNRGKLLRRPFKVEQEDVQDKPKPWIPAERMAEFFATLAAQGAPLRAQQLCWLMMTLGLRESEARHARVEHTDLVNLWHIPYDPEVGTKGGEADPVPIPSWAAAEIAAMIGDRREGLLVPGRTPGRPVKRCYTLEYVAAAGVAMGIPGLTPHCLRGTCATLLSLEGAQVKAIQKVLRHKDPRTTEIYIRPVMQSVRDAGARVGEKAGFSASSGAQLARPPKTRRQLKKEKDVAVSSAQRTAATPGKG